MQTRLSQLSPHLYVHHGHVNTGILRDGNRGLLIDPSGTTVHTTLTALGITKVEQVLFTPTTIAITQQASRYPIMFASESRRKGQRGLARLKLFGTTQNTDGTSTTTVHTISCSPTPSV